jgi:hypothetical protein
MTRTNIDFSNGKMIRKIEIFHHPQMVAAYELMGLRFYDQNNQQMLSVGAYHGTKKDILLEENERIFGVTSLSRTVNGYPGAHADLQFMIYKIN